MKFQKFLNGSFRFILSALILSVAAFSGNAQQQKGDADRQTVAVTYPLDQTVKVGFRGTTRFPRLKGEAKVIRQGRRGTRVQLNIENMPRAIELGGIYTTFVLWAITPEGRVDNMGEIKRSGSVIVDTKIDVTTPLQTFALIVTAEPHYLVRGPSRMVILENLPPRNPAGAEVETVTVQYLGNSSDYFTDRNVPEIAEADYIKTPVSLLGARQAVNLARYVGAERDAPNELQYAREQLEEAEQAWRLKQPEADVDIKARLAISAGVKAEEVAEARKAARQRREEIARRDAAVRNAEANAEDAKKEIEELKAELQREQRGRELSERDASNYSQQNTDLRAENARLREEVQALRAEAEEAKVKLARLEGEKQAEDARRAAEQKAAQVRAQAVLLKQSLAAYGNVTENTKGIVLTLPENFWTAPRVSSFTPTSLNKLDSLGALLANNPDYQVVIESYTDGVGDVSALQQLTQERAQAIADRLIAIGVDAARVQAAGMGSSNPIASNAKAAARIKNRRTEITLILNFGGATTTKNQ
jgi:outer membrane protein OmpA-like peptidoglycan-associated protein